MEMKNKDFAVFILTHGRPDNVITVNTLKRSGYTGKVYFIIDNEDNTAEKYYKNFGRKKVVMFDKKKYADECDEGNNFDERRTITMARNACFDIAKQLKVKYFIELDDDYTCFEFRMNNKGEYLNGFGTFKNTINQVFDSMIEFYKNTTALSVAIAQGGDFIGGYQSYTAIKMPLKRKCMNSFLCSNDRPFRFVGAMNEDVNTYTTIGSRGGVFFTIPFFSLKQKETQSQAGGITDMYKKYGTYCKSFTTVMMMPSCVKVGMLNSKFPRLHHKISWNNTVPKIVSEDLKKLV